MALPNRVKSNIALGIAALLAVLLAASAASVLTVGHRAASVESAPRGAPADVPDGSPFPYVDWEYWLGVNPAIVGWVSVPGTNIDQPIVQESPHAVGHWLWHNVYGEWSYAGVPYLDAECAGQGLDGPNSVVLGHNMGWNSDMFADFARYADAGYAAGHRTILLQTPQWRKKLVVQASHTFPGWSAIKRVAFADGGDFRRWWEERFAECGVKLAGGAAETEHLYTFATCSYFNWQDERTVVYACEQATG